MNEDILKDLNDLIEEEDDCQDVISGFKNSFSICEEIGKLEKLVNNRLIIKQIGNFGIGTSTPSFINSRGGYISVDPGGQERSPERAGRDRDRGINMVRRAVLDEAVYVNHDNREVLSELAERARSNNSRHESEYMANIVTNTAPLSENNSFTDLFNLENMRESMMNRTGSFGYAQLMTLTPRIITDIGS